MQNVAAFKNAAALELEEHLAVSKFGLRCGLLWMVLREQLPEDGGEQRVYFGLVCFYDLLMVLLMVVKVFAQWKVSHGHES